MYISGIKVLKRHDNFGGKLVIFNETKCKTWVKLIKAGWQIMPNKRYLNKGRMYVYNNRLLSFLSVKH